MVDVNGYRAKIGSIIPSTNTTVEFDCAQVRLPGVTFHSSRVHVRESDLRSAEAQRGQIDSVKSEVGAAIERVLTCRPDHLMMGVSAPTFWGGRTGSEAFHERLTEYAGAVEITTGATATLAALETLGLRDIAVLTPYGPMADEQVKLFLQEHGYNVRRISGIPADSMTSIAEIAAPRLIHELKQLDGPDVEGIVQVGTDLSMVRVADEAERWLGKPVIAINAATAWRALRACGVDDRLHGMGVLLREY